MKFDVNYANFDIFLIRCIFGEFGVFVDKLGVIASQLG